MESVALSRLESEQRLTALRMSGLLRYEEHDRLARLCYTVTQLLQVEVSQLSVVTATEQIFISEWPPHVRLLVPLNVSSCRYVIESDDVIAINDTRSEHLPWADEFGAYLGAPVRLHGYPIGSLCALSIHARDWTEQDRLALSALASLVSASVD